MTEMGGEFKKLGGDLNKVSHGMQAIGLGVDTQVLSMVSAAFQLVGGSASAIKGLMQAKEAYNAWRAAEGQANLLKWGPWGIVVQAQAQAGAQAMGFMIGEAVRNIQSDGSGQSMRGLAGGMTYGR